MVYLPSRKACQLLGVHPNTLRRWAEKGEIGFIKTASGQRKYDIETFLGQTKQPVVICYCRVSSQKQKDDLTRQVDYMRERFPDCEVIKDIGSGINFRRKGLRSILERAMSGDKLKVVSAHRDRVCRFGFDLVRWIIEKSGGELLVLDQSSLSPEQELTRDLLTILHVFSCRMHGLRSYKNKIAEDFANKGTETNVQTVD
jgi:excisionase family DNA binding protein